jgi:hypothetical protein
MIAVTIHASKPVDKAAQILIAAITEQKTVDITIA